MAREKIIAVDFDGTLCAKARYPNIGKANDFLFAKLLAMQKQGCKLILFTCRTGADLERAVEFCRSQGLIFDAINQNIKKWDGEIRAGGKVYADIYIDDKSVNPLPFNKIEYDLQPMNWRER